MPFLLAVQVKHSRVGTIGPEPARDLLGVVRLHGFNAGMLVTNTTFTPDARWVEAHAQFLLRLRDGEDLKRYLRNELAPEHEWRRLPSSIEICPGISIPLPA
jgi:hypothetical protein